MDRHIVDEINKYMDNPLKYAILLEGTWGSGKTYFVKNQLTHIDTIYISLNGISNLNNVTFQIAYQIIGEKLLGNNKTKGKRIAGTVGSLLVSHLESKTNIDFSELVNLLGNIKFDNKLIIFDDLERCNMPIEEILGFINTLVEHNKIKVLIVANEKEIKENEYYIKIKEKLIYQTFK